MTLMRRRRSMSGAVLLWLAGATAFGAVYTVSNTDDSGPGSLRQCIINANTNRGRDEIRFDPPGGLFPYFVISNRLPTITDSVIIDGTTAPFWNFTPVVVLDGKWAFNAGNGLQIFASNCWIKALNIQRFPGSGIQIIGGESNVIHRCKIGVDQFVAYNGDGIQIFDANYNTVGGSGVFERN